MELIKLMAQSLQLPIPFIEGIARKASYAYKTYTIPKRRNGFRVIHQPSQELKALQRWLLHNIIYRWPIHDAVFAYVSGRGIKENAQSHVYSRYLLRIDLKDFFPSITSTDIDYFLNKKPPGTENWEETDRALFRTLVCRNGRLTIGAPTSPGLSNALCYDLDIKLTGVASRNRVVYTRYADDLFFSTELKDVLKHFPKYISSVLKNLKCPQELRINHEKILHSSKKGRRQVTGLVLTSDGNISLGRKRKRYIRGKIHCFNRLDSSEQAKLSGLLAFAISIDPDFYNSLVLKYGRGKVEMVRKGRSSY